MVCRTELINSLSYNYCLDDLPPRADRLQAIIQGRFLDELTGNGLVAQLTISTGVDHLIPRSALNGIAGLVANPARRFPGLAANSVNIDIKIACRRYITQSFIGSLGPFNIAAGYPNDFPDSFEAINLGDVGLHRQATRLTGRCVQNNGVTRTPLNNATVDISGLWHQFPAADVDPLAVVQSSEIISLLQGLYAQRQTGVDQVRQRSLLPLAGEEKSLLLPAVNGDTRLRLSNRINLAAGQVLAIDIGHSDLVEYLQVDSVLGASTNTQPATVRLAYPLLKPHREGVSVVRVNPQPPGTANNLIHDAIPGDQTIFLDALTDLTNSTVEISGSGAPEYHQMHLYSVLSDAEGYFSLPPISRVAMMQLHASHAVPVADVDLVVSPDYEQFENRIDLIFS